MTESDQPQPSDNELLRQIAEGDRQAFAELFRRHEKKIYNFIAAKLNDFSEASDIVNEVYLDVWKSAGKFEGRSKATSWLFSIAHNKTVDRIRKKVPMPVDDTAIPEQIDEDADTFAAINALDEAQHLHHCLAKLSEAQRSVVQLAFFDDLSYGDIADIIGRPEGTVKTRIFHAKQALKTCLQKIAGEMR